MGLSLNHHHNNNLNGVIFLTLYIVLISAIKNKDKISRTCVMQDRRSPLAKRKNGGNSKDLHPIKIRHEVIWNNQLIALLVSCSLADPKKFKFLRGMPSLVFLCVSAVFFSVHSETKFA